MAVTRGPPCRRSACQAWLPAGEVLHAGAQHVSWTFVADTFYFQGKHRRLTMKFSKEEDDLRAIKALRIASMPPAG
jgi:hypothetical protein